MYRRTFDYAKNFWALRFAEHGYTSLYLDTDVVVLKHPFKFYIPSYDIQVPLGALVCCVRGDLLGGWAGGLVWRSWGWGGLEMAPCHLYSLLQKLPKWPDVCDLPKSHWLLTSRFSLRVTCSARFSELACNALQVA
jgi:hypothetical protein